MTDDQKLRDYLKRVTVDLHDARARLREVEGQGSEPIAIVGMSCRYPGDTASPQQLWEMVSAGRDAISGFPSNRGWDLERLYDPDPDSLGTTYVREGGFVEDVADFDADFFSISPKEALAMDPQQRALLEASWEAIESAGIEPLALRGSQTGVFVGGASNGYGAGAAGTSAGAGGESVDGHYGSGTLSSIMSGRVSYTLGLEGPALTIDTACSSSLVALHVACGSLRSGESSLALVGGVNVMPTPIVFVELARQRGLAPDGRCKSYADGADGTSWSEGVGVVVLERLSDARRHGHRVLAMVRGSAVNQDGASNGLTAPNGPSQQRVIRSALANAGLSTLDVDAVEGHGTGTTLGDPIEAQALLATYGRDRPEDRPLWLGSIKSNIGHPQAAAGVAGVIKMVMALQHELLPRTLHVDRPTQQVNWGAGRVSLLVQEVPWPRTGEPRRAAVSSFGASGTNAHVILEEAAVEASDLGEPPARPGVFAAGVAPLVVSARTEAGLRGQAARLSSHLGDHASLGMGEVGLALTRRSAFDHRAVAVGGDRAELLGGLEAIAGELPCAEVVRGAVGPLGPGGIAFVFPGQGSQWPGMAVELLDRSTAFAARLRECGQALAPLVDWSLEDVLRGAPGAPQLDRVDVVQPALFAVMIALAELWQACGVRPSVVVGHSQGEIAAACVAGALSLDDAARVVAMRSRALVSIAGLGGMVSAAVGPQEIEAHMARFDGDLSLASVNGPHSVVVSGETGALDRLLEDCQAQGVKARRIPVDYAAHSAQVERIRDELLQGCAEIEPRSATLPFYSAVTGGIVEGRELDAGYWYRNLREPVEFERATRALLADGYRTLVEISPHPVLAVGLHETVEDAQQASGSSEVGIHGSLRRGDGGPHRFLMSLSELWVRGVDIDWDAIFAGIQERTLQLPTYAFQRQRYWLESAPRSSDVSAVGQTPAAHPLLGATLALAEDGGRLLTGRISLQRQPWFADHTVGGLVLVPGTTFVEIALRAGVEADCDVLQDLVFEAPLVLSGDGARRLQVAVGAPGESGQRTVGIFSCPDDDSGVEEESPWTRHARGVLAAAGQAAMDELPELEGAAASFAAEAWPPAGAEPLAVDDLYDYFAGVGLEYGPSFLSVRAAWRRGEEAFTEVRLPEDQLGSAREFGIHPALLDCALQTGGVLMRTEHDATPENAVLPFAWSRVRLHATGTSSLRVRLARLETGGMSVLAADEHGRPVLSAESVVVRKIAPEVLRELRGTASHPLLHLEWLPVGAAAGSGQAPTPVRSLAVLGERVPAGLGALVPDATVEDDSSAPTRHASLGALCAAIADGAAVPDAVLVGLGSGLLADGETAQPAATHRVLDLGLSLVQEWLMQEPLASSRLVFVTEGAVSTALEEGVEDLAAAALWGLLRSAQSENPGRFVLVDLDGSPVLPGALRAVLDSDESQLALRGDRALAARLRRAPSGDGSEPEPGDTPRRAEIGLTASGDPGTVLITGGTGALGALLARHLVERHGVRNLTLVGRRGIEAPGAERLQAELMELGAEARIAACDVSDRAQLAELLDSLPAERPLSAVVHAAGALDDGVIDSMSPERIDRVLTPKADAAWHLHELTQGLDLSAFVLFSSSTGTLGGPAQSNYAAANAFLDALSAQRRAVGLPCISMAWGWWAATGGMAGELSLADRTRMERSGMLPLSGEEGLNLFDAAYLLGEPVVIPARLDTAGMRSQMRSGAVPPLFRGLVRVPAGAAGQSAGGSLARRLQSTPPRERERVALDLVRAEVASVLGHPSPDAIDVQRPFNELGFDSLAAVELRNRLSVASGIQLPATLVFDHPTTMALTELLLERISPEPAGPDDRGVQEIEIRDALASIPLARLREAGVMDTLLQLAGLAQEPSSPAEEDRVDLIDEMDIESLVKMTLEDDEVVGESGVRS
jgi:acyl transferase domain-containing protein/acyl carrier protein